jgi:hypothetical protein
LAGAGGAGTTHLSRAEMMTRHTTSLLSGPPILLLRNFNPSASSPHLLPIMSEFQEIDQIRTRAAELITRVGTHPSDDLIDEYADLVKQFLALGGSQYQHHHFTVLILMRISCPFFLFPVMT